ncbi:MAG: metal ABC transporter permease [Parcubacteria group bacterium]|nr:metal ABC transporter permease [Parcubacteria group bacterium]
MVFDFYLFSGATVLAIAASLVGIFVIQRRMALVTDAMSHVALPGLALGILYRFNPFIGAFVALGIAVAIVFYLETRTRLAVETIVGILFTAALAFGILLTPEEHLIESLFGDIQNFTRPDFWLLFVGSTCVLVLVLALWRGLARTFFSKDVAFSERVSVRFFEGAYLFLLVLLVALGVKVVGSLLMGALIVLPAASAKNIARSLRSFALVAVLAGVVAVAGGLLLASVLRIPSGPAIILVSTVLFGASLAFVRR